MENRSVSAAPCSAFMVPFWSLTAPGHHSLLLYGKEQMLNLFVFILKTERQAGSELHQGWINAFWVNCFKEDS